MRTDQEILASVRNAFASVERPEHFTHHTHCDECFEHDETLRSRDLDTLTREDVASAAWDPITMATPQGFAYYLPALARLTLETPHEHWGWYGEQLLSQLCWNGPRHERWLYCNAAQRRAAVNLLEHVMDTRQELIEQYECSPDLLQAIDIWSDDGEPSSPPPGV